MNTIQSLYNKNPDAFLANPYGQTPHVFHSKETTQKMLLKQNGTLKNVLDEISKEAAKSKPKNLKNLFGLIKTERNTEKDSFYEAQSDAALSLMSYRDTEHAKYKQGEWIINYYVADLGKTVSYQLDKTISLGQGMKAYGYVPVDKNNAPSILLFPGTAFNDRGSGAFKTVAVDLDIKGVGHTLFMKNREKLQTWINKHTNENRKAKAIGHSLGGTLANLSWVYLDNVEKGTGFCAPGISEKTYKYYLKKKKENPKDYKDKNYHNLLHPGDPTPYLHGDRRVGKTHEIACKNRHIQPKQFIHKVVGLILDKNSKLKKIDIKDCKNHKNWFTRTAIKIGFLIAKLFSFLIMPLGNLKQATIGYRAKEYDKLEKKHLIEPLYESIPSAKASKLFKIVPNKKFYQTKNSFLNSISYNNKSLTPLENAIVYSAISRLRKKYSIRNKDFELDTPIKEIVKNKFSSLTQKDLNKLVNRKEIWNRPTDEEKLTNWLVNEIDQKIK